MKTKKLIIPICLIFSIACQGQVLQTNQKKKIIKQLNNIISENYVLQDSVNFITEQLTDLRKTDDFNKEHEPAQFASYLTQTLRSITGDAHFAILNDAAMYNMALALQQNDQGENSPAMSFRGNDMNDRRTNYFFTKLEVLKGNIGYLKIEQMPSLDVSKNTLDAAMTFLNNTDALVIDLRSNPGGIGGFIPYFMSYFFNEQKKLLYTREFMAWDSVAYLYTHENLGANRYLNKPVYLLINQFTGSAATNMAYTMKSFDRAVLVGENTGSGYRGAHSATIYPLQDNYVAMVPIGRVVNARTKTNWRANGVDPHIEASSDKALDVAYRNVLEELKKKMSNQDVISEINTILDELNKTDSAQEDDMTEDLSEFAGQYEGTSITWDNGKLYTKRATVPMKLELQRKKGDLFKIMLPPNVRGNVPDLRFDRKDGVIVSITTIRDGNEERTELRNDN